MYEIMMFIAQFVTGVYFIVAFLVAAGVALGLLCGLFCLVCAIAVGIADMRPKHQRQVAAVALIAVLFVGYAVCANAGLEAEARALGAAGIGIAVAFGVYSAFQK